MRRIFLVAVFLLGALAVAVRTRSPEPTPPRAPIPRMRAETRIEAAIEPATPSSPPSIVRPLPDEDNRLARLNLVQEDILRGLEDGRLAPQDLLARLQTEDDPGVLEAIVYGVIGSTAAAADPAFRQGLRALAASADAPVRRAAAVSILARSPGATDEDRALVARLALSDPAPALRASAAVSLRDVFQESPPWAKSLLPGLLDGLGAESDAAVRQRLASALDLRHGAELETAQAGRLLTAEPDAGVRIELAHAMTALPPAQRAAGLDHLAEAYRRETEPDVRLSMLSALLRLGGPQATAKLETLPESDPSMRRRIDDCLKVLREGGPDLDLRLEQAMGGP